MKPVLTSLALTLTAFSLQGCVAAVIPVAAAGVLGKKQLDKDKGDKAEPAAVATAKTEDPPAVAETAEQDAVPLPAANTVAAPVTGDNPYAGFVNYALERARAREAGDAISSAILVENPSLSDPRTIDCAAKPLAVIIDADRESVSMSSIDGLSAVLAPLRTSGIRIAWVGKGPMARLESALEMAGLLDRTDIILPVGDTGPRKQEQRTGFAVGHCVLAIAGDRQTDFDELFDYLEDARYAESLKKFHDAGWFTVPAPLTQMEIAP